ncbi:hypothetical protein [Planctobacterium marinum]|uniref:hypothetical protein n=1 Tax=Planctobacterium marinum TaxID=1631968 RepID=UPI001E3A93AF|nr:hypothetical protein [Planctobacterium marinum]MCC2605456.1 hypothetical protein [Planctobacterium marinum]
MEKKKDINKPQHNAFRINARQVKLIVAGIILFLLVIFPKPQRITYEYANMVTVGTYWDGLFGPGVLFDSNAKFVRLDEDTEHLHVCFARENDNCLRYKVIKNTGFGGYISSWFEED